MADICLVSMPYGAIERPSLAIGILVAGAKEAGLSAEALYATFAFAEQVGLPIYKALTDQGDVADLLGEWTFARSAFPDHNPDHDAYLRRVLSDEAFNAAPYRFLLGDIDLVEALWSVRARADDFVTSTAERILASRPRIVGCSSVFQQHCASLALLRRIKALAPDVVTLLGGANCEGAMGQVVQRRFPWVDYVVSGEADLLFPGFCRALLEHGARLPPASLPHGVMHSARWPARMMVNGDPPRAAVREMDRTPVPDFGDYFEQLSRFAYREVVAPGLLLETSRGCWWGAKHHCTFCGLNGGALFFRSKSRERVLAEVDELTNRHGINKLAVVDNILDMKYFQTVLPELASRPTEYKLFYETKANLDESQVRLLSDAGVRWIQPGIESLHDEFLKRINKGTTALTNVTLLKFALENGIAVTWNLLFGIPSEQDDWYDEMAEWVPLISHLQPPSSVVRIRYDRFSPYFAQAEQFGISPSPNTSYRAVFPVGDEDLADLAYYFEDYDDTGRGRLDNPSIARLNGVVVEWNRRFWKNRSALVMAEGERGTLIWDSRPGQPQAVTVLDGLAHAVHRACRTPRSPAALLRHLAGEGYPDLKVEELETVIQDLIARHLLLHLNDRLLSLAVRQPRRPLLPPEAFPGGHYQVVPAALGSMRAP